MGLDSRLRSASVSPAARSRSIRSSWVRRDPIAPTYPTSRRSATSRTGTSNFASWVTVWIRTAPGEDLSAVLSGVEHIIHQLQLPEGVRVTVRGSAQAMRTAFAAFGFGLILGFRVTTNALSALAGCLLLLAFALALCWASALIGMLVKTPQGVQAFGFIAFFPLVFGSNLLAPTDTMPGWLQAFVKVNPMTLLTDAERGLFTGGPVATPAVQSLLWALGIFVVFAPLAVRVYRRRT